MTPTVTVAIVTARTGDQIAYDELHKRRRELLLSPDTPGELRAFVSALFQGNDDVLHHVDYQLRALALGIDQPDEVLVIDRHLNPALSVPNTFSDSGDDSPYPFPVSYHPPQVSKLELTGNGCLPPFSRASGVPLECNDKNTAILLCRTDVLVMLDDACLPGIGLVTKAREVCAEGAVLAFGHRKLIFDEKLTWSEANWMCAGAPEERTPFGIWAAPLGVLLDVDGLCEALDGRRYHTDIDFRRRVEAADYSITTSPGAHVWELPHEPVTAQPMREFTAEDAESGANWPPLRMRRKAAQAYLDQHRRLVEALEVAEDTDDDEEL